MNNYKRNLVTVMNPNAKFVQASIPKLYDNLQIIVDSEENIFDQIYMSALMPNQRVCKFLKESLSFKNGK
jgi:hypothetical protein